MGGPDIRDDDGAIVKVGDRINFSYGIPGVRVEGDLVEEQGVLSVLTPGHKPERCELSKLRGYVGHFWKMRSNR